ncbi:MAG: type II 3-dehydroquinate dehydratase [Roseovarius sp.]|nr:type II 3-dehydroquinate dehydratase [Roseovarius sp.]MCY4316038.1 type II 3-dehydroquinate dehydratase [Roseovarius sp.]
MTSILILNGANLNMLGTRQPEIYGSATLDDIKSLCIAKAEEMGIGISFQQSNSEGALIDEVHMAKNHQNGIIVNAGAYTHTSIALMDALISVDLPVIELHLSNIHAREEFRHKSYIANAAIGIICGFGAYGYELAIDAMTRHLGIER